MDIEIREARKLSVELTNCSMKSARELRDFLNYAVPD